MAQKPNNGADTDPDKDDLEEDLEAGDDGAKDPDHPGSQKKDDADAGGDKSGEEGEDDEDVGGEEALADDGSEPPVRRSAAQNIIARKNQTIAKLKKDAGTDTDTGVEEGEDEDTELAPETVNLVRRQIRKEIEPLQKVIVSQADELELRELFDIKPEAKKMEKTIRKYMEHSAYAQVPVSSIYAIVASQKTSGQNDKKRDAADKDAKLGGPVGRQKARSSARPKSDWENVAEMDDKKVDEIAQRAMRGEYREE